jgi:Phosphotransferase System HPr (HPr) Family
MQSFEYTIKDELGIHARPAGLLVKLAKNYESSITVHKNAAAADAKKIMALMSLGVTKGTTVTVNVEGADEAEAGAAVQLFFTDNL